MRKMKGVGITAQNKVEVLDDCVLPEEKDISPYGALITPKIWSPCTSDAHQCATGCATLPYLLGKACGHEMCGVVNYVGSEVKDFKPGDRVIVDAIMPRWRSLEAQDGHASVISDNMYWGVDYPDRGGVFVENYYIRDADMNLAHIPDNVTWEQAVMVPDMMCTAFAGAKALELEYGDSVAVIGVGPVGLMATRACVLGGAGKIYVVGSRKVCFKVAKEYGATECVDYHNEDYIDEIIKLNGGPVDKVIIAGGNADSINKALQVVKRGGIIANLSAYFQDKELPINAALWGYGYSDKTIKAIPCAGGRNVLNRMVNLIATGRVQPEKLITHRYTGMEKITDAMDLFLNHDRSLIKPVILADEN